MPQCNHCVITVHRPSDVNRTLFFFGAELLLVTLQYTNARAFLEVSSRAPDQGAGRPHLIGDGLPPHRPYMAYYEFLRTQYQYLARASY